MTDGLFNRRMAIPAATQAGRAAKVCALLGHVLRSDRRGPEKEVDWDKRTIRSLLGEFVGMSPAELEAIFPPNHVGHWTDGALVLMYLGREPRGNMAHLYFHIRTGDDFIEDREGSEYPSLAEARADAVRSAREIMAMRVISGKPPNHSTFEISDASGRCVLAMPFLDALDQK